MKKTSKKTTGKPQNEDIFNNISVKTTKIAGSPVAFVTALSVIIVWGISGIFFRFSDTWQLVINTGTTIITFLMVFLIQQSQNKDTVAIHLKLNELIAATKGASNRLIDVEDLTPKELDTLKNFYIKLSQLAEKEQDISCTHTIEEAEELHVEKSKNMRGKKV